MTKPDDSLLELYRELQRKAPEYVDLITARTQEEFEKAFVPILEKAVHHLETNKKGFQNLDEEHLTAVLAASISMPGLVATQETHSNGHVDITITAEHTTPMRKKLGEAKIYDGPEYHIKGLEQLLGRYLTGRETNGLIIEYVQKKDISGLIKKVRERFDKDYPCDQSCDTEDHTLNWAFSSKHKHSCGDDLRVDHVACNLFCDE
jgi:hypothetical protein